MADIEKGRVAYNEQSAAGAAADPNANGAQAPYGAAGVPHVHGLHPWNQIGNKPIRRLGNPGPLGLTSFASTTLVLSFFNVQTRGVTEPNVVVGMALFVGGLAQLLAGMWEFACGNTFGATAFSAYGTFWLSYATILIPGSGIVAAYDSVPNELHNALGIFLTSWFIFTALMFVAALRRNVGFIALLFFLTITFLLLAIAEFRNSVTITKAGGGFGLLTAAIAYYCAMAELLRPDDSWFTLPLGHIPKRVRLENPCSELERHQVYHVVRRIPPQRVTSYGHIAKLLGMPRHARLVGQALKFLSPQTTPPVPWHRVVSASGAIASRGPGTDGARRQRQALEAEGVVVVDGRGGEGEARVRLREYGWFPAVGSVDLGEFGPAQVAGGQGEGQGDESDESELTELEESDEEGA
ncbi:hypothetical protein PUNSTDRAFT_128761 [Punctularia strigosozonata HHB-11173 SS5]|uniref:Methylated-DNA-[protein]-cysteine S-methyltransferase DNA binding domain-containing protein n=1 Tax=Punctularia strigosozonata (strain HHB-11173) TaxID=741275 RepID=R7S0Z4_PUNST|nr:uncharacterized protein PUNSTDRAFT_128761 [Punctularia strigosozonata HHB-11173 SS5]EIN03467.1 hypothetical protein PUNSTDRAFT_128761 [Punctularia strigosozonata HHB-11173 SS5]